MTVAVDMGRKATKTTTTTLKSINIIQLSNNYNIVSSFICWNQNIVHMKNYFFLTSGAEILLLFILAKVSAIPKHVDLLNKKTGPRSAVGNVSGYRCVSDCRSRGREFDPGPVPYFRGD